MILSHFQSRNSWLKNKKFSVGEQNCLCKSAWLWWNTIDIPRTKTECFLIANWFSFKQGTKLLIITFWRAIGSCNVSSNCFLWTSTFNWNFVLFSSVTEQINIIASNLNLRTTRHHRDTRTRSRRREAFVYCLDSCSSEENSEEN